MVIVKRKSLIVALVSSFVIALVLILTLIGYLAYIELKGEEFKRSYEALLQKVNAKVYAKYIDIQKLSARIENSGALKGKPIVEGTLINKGYKNISSILLKVKFMDKDGAIIYDVAFRPQDPALEASVMPLDIIPYLSGHPKTVIKPSNPLPFKTILANCPNEIIQALREKTPYAKGYGRWAGRLVFEVLSIDF